MLTVDGQVEHHFCVPVNVISTESQAQMDHKETIVLVGDEEADKKRAWPSHLAMHKPIEKWDIQRQGDKHETEKNQSIAPINVKH